IVSTVVNMFILPPNYIKEINDNIEKLYRGIRRATLSIVTFEKAASKKVNRLLNVLSKQIKKTEELIRLQKDETNFHPLDDSKKEDCFIARNQIDNFKLMIYHLTNIKNIFIEKVQINKEKKLIIEDAVESLAEHMVYNTDVDLTVHEVTIKRLMQTFWLNNNIVTDEMSDSHLPSE